MMLLLLLLLMIADVVMVVVVVVVVVFSMFSLSLMIYMSAAFKVSSHHAVVVDRVRASRDNCLLLLPLIA